MSSFSGPLKYDIAVQGPKDQGAILRLISRAVKFSEPVAFMGAFAYATKKGMALLCETLNRVSPSWEAASKRWIISIDFGYTEPEAISALADLHNSEVRIPYAREVLSNGLRPKHTFHGKSLLFHQGNALEDGKGGIIVASANMTMNGMCFGHEHASACNWSRCQDIPNYTWESLSSAFLHLNDLFGISETPTKTLIKKYWQKRSRHVGDGIEDSGPEIRRVSKPTAELSLFQNASLATAKCLWVDVDYVAENRGSGKPGNQIDLQHGTRVFFGMSSQRVAPNTMLGEVAIMYRDHSVACHMRFGNNQMDKLNLPVPEDGGPPPYNNKTLLFTKKEQGAFLLNVRSRESAKAWKSKSRRQNTLFTMRSGRQYGVFA